MGKSTISTGPFSIAFCMFTRGYESRKGGYLAELEASLFSEGLHTLGEKPSTPEMTGAVPAVCASNGSLSLYESCVGKGIRFRYMNVIEQILTYINIY